jgi:hypothetical protein
MKKLLLSLVLLVSFISCSPDEIDKKSYSIVMEASPNGFEYVKKNGQFIQSDDQENVFTGTFIINNVVSGDTIEGKGLYSPENGSTVQIYIRPDNLPNGQTSGFISYFFEGDRYFSIILE